MKKKAMYGLAALALVGLLAVGFTSMVSAEEASVEPVGDCQNIENAPDADGDGIPNGMDPDFERPMDGTGMMRQYKGEGPHGNGMGDGSGEGKMYRHGYMYHEQNNGTCMAP